MNGFARGAVDVLLLGVLVLLAFGQSLEFDFVWDDRGLIVDNPHIKELEGARQTLTQDFWAVGELMEAPTRRFYRPLISLSYAADHALWGLDPRGYHLTNLVGHALASILAYALALLLLGGRPAAFLAAAMFAVHPSHVENVCWISGRTDVFCGVFYFMAMCAFLRSLPGGDRSGMWALLSILAYFAALMCKETAITLPVVAFLAQSLLQDSSWRSRRTLLTAISFVAATLLYFALRVSILGELVSGASFGSSNERILSIPMVFATYLGGLLTLVPLDPHHDTAWVQHARDIRFVIGACSCLLYLVGFILLLRRGARRSALLLACIPLLLAPVFKLGSFGDILHADRFLYLPSFAFAALVALAAEHFMATPRRLVPPALVRTALVGIVLVWAGNAHLYAPTWRDDVTLFETASRTSPDSAYVFYNLGAALAKAGDRASAVHAFARAIQLEPRYNEAITNLAISLTFLGHHSEAIRTYQRALSQDFRHPVLHAGMAVSYRALGKLPESIAMNRESLRLGESIIAHNNLAECLVETGELDEARRHLDLAASIAVPGGLPPEKRIAVQSNFVKYHLARGDRASAATHARQVLDLMEESGMPEVISREAARLKELVNSSASPSPASAAKPWSAMRVIDVHGHIGSFSGYDIGLETLLENIRRYGVERVLVSNIDGANMPGTTRSLDPEEANRITLSAVKANPELVGLAWARPGEGDPSRTVKPFLEQGFRGIKMHPRFDRFAADDAIVDPYFTLAALHKVPVVFHCDEAAPIHRAARRHPGVPVVLYHSGFFKDHEEAIRAVEEAIRAKDADLYLETSQVEAEKSVEMVRRVGADHVIFGTDATYFGKDHYAKYTGQLERLRASISAEDFEKVVRGNAIRLFRLP